jgi:serine protease Do
MAAAPSLDLLGSGFVVNPSGIVLTNKHVVAGGHQLIVQTADGRQFSVEDVKMDREHDLAILRIESGKPLASVRLGDSVTAEIGDWVLTIGCPLELEQTVSAGIVSAKNRSLCSKHPAKFIQTDAVVNPGSSGGPLVNLRGEVIGVTTAIASEDGGYQGIGFAIPANHAVRLLALSGDPKDLP